MSVESMINLILAVVTGITAIIALLLTLRQIKLSNKQYLFERRLDKYLLIKDLLTLYKSSVSILEKETFFENVDFAFNSLVNCARLEDIYWVIEDPKDSDARKKFLIKCEGLERSALEITLLWKGESGELISTFVKQYSDLLRALLRQQVAVKSLEKQGEKGSFLLEEVQDKKKQSAVSYGLFDAAQAIAETYKKIIENDVEQILRKNLSLL